MGRIDLNLSVFGEPLMQQLKSILPARQLKRFEAQRVAIDTLKFSRLLTSREAHNARKRLTKVIQLAIDEHEKDLP
jgi:hypothetical protein